jgi:hypothetical protein
MTEPDARRWLATVQRDRLASRYQQAAGAGWAVGDAEEDLRAHPAWRVHQLDGFGRRLRLLLAGTQTSATALSGRLGVGPHHISHGIAGRSWPDRPGRTAIAQALGLHPAWFAPGRDQQADRDLYRFPDKCPWGSDQFVFADFEGPGSYDLGKWALATRGWWCTGCGQPYLAGPDGPLLAVATMEPSTGPVFHAVTDDPAVRGSGNCGPELARPWPHSLWHEPHGLNERGPLRLSALYRRPPTW